MKIAFLSDIHSNIEAFDAVLKIIEQKTQTEYIAGDLVGYYYYADEVIDLCE